MYKTNLWRVKKGSAMHAVLMGDIVGSERTPSVEMLHQRFNRAIHAANQRHAAVIVSPLTITLGDEFQGLLPNLHAATLVARELRLDLLQDDVDCRFVVGRVDIRTPFNTERAWNMMGPGLAEARHKLDRKTTDSRYHFSLPEAPATQALLDAVGTGLTATERRWTRTQLHDIAETIAGRSAESIAERRHVNARSIYKARTSGAFDSYAAQWEGLLTALRLIDEQRGNAP